MSERDDVVRWSADPDAPAGMRELVRRATAADAGPSTVQLASMRGRIAAQLAAGPPVTAALIGARTIVVGLVVAAIGAGVVTYLATRPAPPPVPVLLPPPALVAPKPAAVAPPPPAALPPSPVAPAPPPPPAPPRSPARHVHAPAAHVAPPEAKPVSPAPAISEVALLEQARAALRGGRAADALGLTAQHATLYADGALGEEREALAIEALVELGRRSDAAARWAKFATAYPQSNYHARLQRLIDEHAAP
jgi:hypothetical protein